MGEIEIQSQVCRLPHRLTCDAGRTIARFFWPGDETRARKIIDRVQGLSDQEVGNLLRSVLDDFDSRHPDLHDVLAEHYNRVMGRLNLTANHSPERQFLIGSYFTMEYSFESAALFNPSMVPARDQSNVPAGAVRFLMSLRAVGEGHVSSIIFRRGIIDENINISFEPVSSCPRQLRREENRVFKKFAFRSRLLDIGAYNETVEEIFKYLPDHFTSAELMQLLEREQPELKKITGAHETVDRMVWLARSNYEVRVPPISSLSEVVLFPISESEAQGMEDMRLVRFVDVDESVRYMGTYTAFNGSRILPQLMEYREADPESGIKTVEIHAFQGRYAKNKGLALFPRRVNGWYMMVGRVDGENLYLLKSDSLYVWNVGRMIQEPHCAWEFVQIGNCGSPIETEVGWLMLTHGVGPMRRYCIGAILLDLDDPERIVSHLDEPLMMPITEERTGYVPNVVYSCGAMVYNGILIIPYGISDAATGFATIPLQVLLDRLLQKKI
jgi:predicted GH43/DUF377 family glycosyl hydrolase